MVHEFVQENLCSTQNFHKLESNLLDLYHVSWSVAPSILKVGILFVTYFVAIKLYKKESSTQNSFELENNGATGH